VTTRPAIDVERVDFISVPVTDLTRATTFYGDVLGLERIPGPERVARVHDRKRQPVPRGPVSNGPPLFGSAQRLHRAACPDVAAARAALEERGVTFDGDIFDTGVCHMGFFRDPDGNALMLHHRYAPPATGADAT